MDQPLSKRLVLLVGLTAATWLVLGGAASVLFEGSPLSLSAIAAGLCLLPAVLTLLLANALRHRPAEEKVALVLVSMVLRMGLTLGGGALLYFKVPFVREQVSAFVSWVIVFYLVTLAAETALLTRSVAASTTGGKPVE